MNANLDEQLRHGLRRAAATSTVPAEGRQLVERRIEARRTRRRRVRHAVTAVSTCGALLVVAVVLNRPADDPQLTTGATADPATAEATPAESTTTGPADDGLPHLVVDHPEFPPTLTRLHDAEIDSATAEQGAYYIQTFRPDPAAWSVPAVTLHTTTDPDYGIGELSPPEVTTTVDINESKGYLVDDPATDTDAPSLGWRLADGTAAHIIAPGLSPQALVDWALTLTLRADGQGWEVPMAPAGLAVAFDGALSPQRRYVGQQLTFGDSAPAADFSPVMLDTHRTTPAHHEQRVHDRLHSADRVDTTVVRGRPAAVVRTSEDVRVLWSEQNDTITNELVLHGTAAGQLDSILSSLAVLSDSEWNQLVADTAPDR